MPNLTCPKCLTEMDFLTGESLGTREVYWCRAHERRYFRHMTMHDGWSALGEGDGTSTLTRGCPGHSPPVEESHSAKAIKHHDRPVAYKGGPITNVVCGDGCGGTSVIDRLIAERDRALKDLGRAGDTILELRGELRLERDTFQDDERQTSAVIRDTLVPLRDENTQLLAENAKLRRRVEELERKLKR